MIDVLSIIADTMRTLGFGYAYMEWQGDAPDPYWVGEYVESAVADESGLQEADFILTGTTRGSWLELEKAKRAIRGAFPPVGGTRHIAADTGNGAAIWYSYAQPVPTDVMDLKRIEIHLTIKTWKVE